MRRFLNRTQAGAVGISAIGWAFIVLLVILVLGSAACASLKTYKLDSRPPAKAVTIDGQADDWRGSLYYSEDGQFNMGFQNDQNNLYVCLVVTDRFKRAQIIMRGLTVWFDPKGGEGKAFGIRFPLGMPPVPGERPIRPDIERDEDLSESIPPESLSELEIVGGASGKPVRVKVSESMGLKLAASAENGLFVYELRIPLVKTPETPWAVGTQPGKSVGVGFETSPFERGTMRPDRFGGGMPGGGRNPMGGGYMGGRRGMGDIGDYGPGTELPQELKIWAVVRLAHGTAAQKPGLLSIAK